MAMFSGLTNIGNTCYMNASLQALYSTLPFRNYVIKYGDDKRKHLHYILSDLFCEMRALNRNICPKELKIAFGKRNKKFSGYNQEDAQEFISLLIEDLQSEVNCVDKQKGRLILPEPTSSAMAWEQYTKHFEKSYLVDLFVGQFNYASKCANGHQYHKWEHFWILDLAVSSKIDSIQKCVDQSCFEEQITAKCNECNQRINMTRKQSFSKLPFILIIQLKVFDNKLRKLTDLGIKITEHLWINGIQYRLYACVCHHGSGIKGGHYTAYCKRNANWYHFNDSQVRSVDNRNILKELSNDAYILFYNKIGINK